MTRPSSYRPEIRTDAFTSSLCALVAFTMLLFGLAFAPVSALALNPERHYEMVSPVYKAGYGIGEILAVSPDGERVEFISHGGFAGLLSSGIDASNAYLARRGSTGWSTASLSPPFGAWVDTSSDLESVVASAPIAPNVGAGSWANSEQEYMFHQTASSESAEDWGVFGGIVLARVDGEPFRGGGANEEGASADLCHLVLNKESDLLPAAANTSEQLYDLSRGCGGGESSLRLVAVDNEGNVISSACEASLGLGTVYASEDQGLAPEAVSNVVSADGEAIYFTTGLTGPCGKNPQVFVRLGATRTLEVSKPLAEAAGCGAQIPCAGAATRPGAYYVGASEDGSKVFFITTAALTEHAAGANLYMASIACPLSSPACSESEKEVSSLTRLSEPASGAQAEAEVQGVTNVSSDGDYTYFVARGVLSEGANPQHQAPAQGAENLYVYDAVSKTLAFVDDLCSGPALSGLSRDSRCPGDLSSGGRSNENDSSLWEKTEREAQTNSCPLASPGCEAGRFLVFTTYAQLLPGDTDSARDVYRYDAATGVLERVSIGEAGADANGNDSHYPASIALPQDTGTARNWHEHELGTRAVSEDGTRIVFASAGPLSPAVSNAVANVYEWHQEPSWSEGRVTLVSSGEAQSPDGSAVISASGRDIFFTTVGDLVSQDTDGLADVYDARLGEGFAPVPAPRQPCIAGDACQGPLSNPAPLLVPGSASQAPGGNYPAPAPETSPPPKRTITKCAKREKLSHNKCVKAKKAKKAARRAKRAGKARGGKS